MQVYYNNNFTSKFKVIDYVYNVLECNITINNSLSGLINITNNTIIDYLFTTGYTSYTQVYSLKCNNSFLTSSNTTNFIVSIKLPDVGGTINPGYQSPMIFPSEVTIANATVVIKYPQAEIKIPAYLFGLLLLLILFLLIYKRKKKMPKTKVKYKTKTKYIEPEPEPQE